MTTELLNFQYVGFRVQKTSTTAVAYIYSVLNNTEAKLCFGNTNENTTKSSFIKCNEKNWKKASSYSKKSARDLESQTVTTQERKLNRPQTLGTNKSENRCYAISNATVKFPNERTLLMITFVCALGLRDR